MTEDPTLELPENIPVPVEDDDELLCEALNLEEEQVWRYEIDIDRRDIDAFRNEPEPKELAFVVSASKRQKNRG